MDTNSTPNSPQFLDDDDNVPDGEEEVLPTDTRPEVQWGGGIATSTLDSLHISGYLVEHNVCTSSAGAHRHLLEGTADLFL
jgi:hypothetical protein